MSNYGSMWIREGRVVVFRQPDNHHATKRGPKVGIVIRETDDGMLVIRAACGARRYLPRTIEVSPDLVAREATEREAVLGHPVDPVPPMIATK